LEENKSIIQKLLRKKPAIFSLVIIALAILICIFGYVLAPDDTANADTQIVEVQSKPAGFSQQFLLLKNENTETKTWLANLFTGKIPKVKYVPITSFKQLGDCVQVSKFIDDDVSVTQTFANTQLFANVNKSVITKKFYFGTDAYGRDILSRLIIGTRVSILVGIIAVLISLTVGIFLGAMAGYYQGKVDAAIMWLLNITWSIPTLLLVFAITLALGKGFWQIFIAVGLTLWVSVARLVRGQVLAVKNLEYIQAAKVLGFSNARIIFKHILPNIIGPILVVAASNFATAIIIEAGLSFLGLGVQPPQPSWGLMIKENYNLIITNNAMQALIPGFAIMLLVLAFNILGNALRDVVDVKEAG
jgi:ABC-type dipeptide/oligopeptide/nickel transport system permease subunit